MNNSNEVGSIQYGASIDLPSLSAYLKKADKLVEDSYKKQAQAAKKASKSSTPDKSGSTAAQAKSRVDEIKREAQQTLSTISTMAPKVQSQFLTLERANMRVTAATQRSTQMIQKYGSDSTQAQNALRNLTGAVYSQSNAQNNLNASLDKTNAKTYSLNESSNSAIFGLNALKAAAIGAGAAIALNIGNAVDRFDTLNNAPKVLQGLGNSAEDSKTAIQALNQGILGLPTSLNQAVSALTRISAASGLSAKSSAALALAFNNMALAGGNGAAEAERALVQFTQAVSKGTLPAEEFNTLMEVMPAQMRQISETMLGAGTSAGQLQDAIVNGKVSMEDFVKAIVTLNTTGGAGFNSFAQQAKDNTAGIRTGWDNLTNAITRGITAMMAAIGGSNIESALSAIGSVFEKTLNIIGNAIGFIARNWNVFGPMAATIGTLALSLSAASLAMRGLAVVSATTTAITGTLRLLMAGQAIAAAAAASGQTAFAASLLATRAAAIKSIASLTIVGTAMAAIGYIAGEVFGNMDNGAKDAKDSTIDLNDVISEIEGGLGGASSGADELAKKMAEVAKQSAKIQEDYRYSLAELVQQKNENIANLRSTLQEEKSSYDNALNERRTSFDKSQNDELLSHQQKTRALQNQIDFLSKYNTASNNKQVEQLRFSLARETAEYQKSTQLKRSEFDAETQSQLEEYEKRRLASETQLNADLALLEKHREEVNSVRGVMLRDQIENLQQQRNEQLRNLQEQTSNAYSQGGAAGNNWANEFTKNLKNGLNSANLTQEGKNNGQQWGIGFFDQVKKFFDDTFGSSGSVNKWIDGVQQKVMNWVYPKWGDDWKKTLPADRRYSGGPVAANKPYLVGENKDGSINPTTEMFVPSSAGNIVSSGDLQKALRGGSSTQNVNVSVNLSGVMASNNSELRAIGVKIAKVINEVTVANTGKQAIQGVA